MGGCCSALKKEFDKKQKKEDNHPGQGHGHGKEHKKGKGHKKGQNTVIEKAVLVAAHQMTKKNDSIK